MITSKDNKMMPEQTAKKERNEEIYRRRMDGESLKQIADAFGISKGRVTQIVNKAKRREEYESQKVDNTERQEPTFFQKLIRTLSLPFREARES